MSLMKERMLRGDLYVADDPDLAADHARAQELLDRYNATRHAEQDERDRLLHSLLGGAGEGVVVKPTFRCDYGAPITIGAGTFVNYDCVMLDVAPITIGSSCQLATRVQLLTATHPIDPEPRRLGWEYGRPASSCRVPAARTRTSRGARRSPRDGRPAAAATGPRAVRAAA
ncbi:MAG: maltose O-acetyltransferase [bacterium]